MANGVMSSLSWESHLLHISWNERTVKSPWDKDRSVSQQRGLSARLYFSPDGANRAVLPGAPKGSQGKNKAQDSGCGDAAVRRPGQDAWLSADSLCGLAEVNDPRFAHLERGCNKPSLL